VTTLDELASTLRDVQLATLVKEAPHSSDWAYELKWDGYRILALKCGARVRLLSRRHQDWTRELEPIAKAVARIPEKNVVLDGEVCALDERGVPSFQRLQNRGRKKTSLVYFAFDLLFEGDEDLRGLFWSERRERLEALTKRLESKSPIVLSAAFEADPARVLASACGAGLEGIVAKRRSAPYTGARTKSWLKVKCEEHEELVVVGWLPYGPDPKRVGALLLAVREPDGSYRFAGKVGTGYDEQTRKELAELLARDRAGHATAKGVPRYGGLVRFVEPRHVAEITFAEWTEGGHVRHPSFVRLRSAEANVVLGVKISHPDRVLDPTGVKKIDLARYYEAIAEVMLPHVRGRPLTLVRWAEGRETEKGGVYLRHARAWGPPALRRVRIREKTKVGEYLVADTPEALVSLAQMDIVEIHTWNATVDDVERPDRLVFDLDPGPGVSWHEIADAARHVRDRLKALAMESWVKTTGGKGLHVVVPVERSAGWAEWLDFSREVVRAVARDAPDRYVTTMSKSVRRGRIYLDYLRNNRTNTSIAAYSIRAKPNAPVSVPVDWDELDELDPESLTMDAVLARITSGRPRRSRSRAGR
jgi:bifunctional non-homologous end joining protein LigD